MTERPPVTCHVLDTTTGKPAAGILCTIYKLDLVSAVSPDGNNIFAESSTSELKPLAMARTNEDGRVDQWTFNPDASQRELLGDLGITKKDGAPLGWSTLVHGTYKIRFQVGKYYHSMGQANFHPFIEIIFEVQDSRHYHIPLLVSNYGYTTYRGS
ncbi:hypothetical protein HG535_0B02880 [Zygotorulaspora mrakii]|uniref:5-hydroxyisourate hydrolase n=1 Tax=Zygotorulaspora mrakii TaxID=42260 RepID=A0A7H9AZU1_ZYGMR|nr:uncharacterized protein HG535_0B02880 [Zygotorulaspora mrakii]QLG71249.1 hypothetical protein HG535_0B02880 [Zygotorulaspora mrakii]